MKKLNKKILLFCLLLYLLTGCAFFPEEEEVIAPPVVMPVTPTYHLYEVKKGDIVVAVNSTAVFQSSQEHTLYFKDIGRVDSVEVRIGDEVKTGDTLISLNKEDLESAIKQQEFALEKVKLTIKHLQKEKNKILKNNANANISDLQLQIDLNRIDQKSIEYQLKKLQDSFEHTRLVSPIDGQVIHLADIKEGDIIQPFQKLVTIADPRALQLVMEYPRGSTSPILKGMKAEITVDTKSYVGEVVSTPADLPPETDERYKNILLLDIDSFDHQVKVGDMAKVSIVTQKKEDVIIIPRQAVREYMGRKYVHILKEDTKKEIDIDIGLESATEVEVLKGLEVGELVILR
ncbi:MAG TPA: efflux RND transporter periplasmic adaptor subunit [Clostridiales bacterium]|jgi:macrolide-specific efflux system membrane fusion protein|nr:efflux RND transporter periplasmic adaptor subunit [Clostridiales bacterium]